MDMSIIYIFKSVLWHGFLITLQLSILSIITGTMLGFLVSLAQTGKFKSLSNISKIYIGIFRGSPLLMQLFMFYFGLPYLGRMFMYIDMDIANILINISQFSTIMIVLTLYAGAYIAEIFRSGYQAIPKGQFEAAQAIGLSYYRMIQKVILPQVVKISYPPLVGFYIGLIKDTSLASIIGYQELVKEGQSVINTTSHPFEVYITIAIVYFVICYPLSQLVARAERRQAVS